MGRFIRQTFIATVANYVGTVIGLVNMVLLYPRFLSEAEFGLTRVLIDAGTLLVVLAELGNVNVASRYFPYFRDFERGHQGFLPFMLAYTTAGYLLFLLAFVLGQDAVLAFYGEQSPLLADYFYLIPVMVFFMTYFRVMEVYSRMHNRPVLPVVLNEVIVKVSNTVAILLLGGGLISLPVFLVLLTTIFGLNALVMFLYIKGMGWLYLRPQWRLYSGAQLRRLTAYGISTILETLGFLLAFRIDTIIIPAYVGLGPAGIYAIAVLVMRFMSLPRVAMTKTSIALLSETIKTGNQAKLRELTQKAALNLTIASVLIFLLIWCNLDALFQLMPKGDYYSQAKPLMLIFMLGRILENSLGLARTLMLSRFFRHQLVLTFLMGAINIALSLWLVQTMGILGVAIGTGVALLLFSVGKFVLLYRGLGANPYTWPLLWILLVGGGVYALQGLLSLPDGGLVLTLAAMALRSLLIAGSFVGLVYWAGWSPQFNQVIDALIHRARRVLGR